MIRLRFKLKGIAFSFDNGNLLAEREKRNIVLKFNNFNTSQIGHTPPKMVKIK